MLAFIYLAIAVVLGDAICRRFITYVSQPHRWATAFLGGLLISSWWTYLSALLFPRSASPLFWGDIVFFATATAAIGLLRKRYQVELSSPDANAARFEKWDWLVIGIFFIFSCWMMFATFNMSGGMLQIGQHEYPDFGSTVSVMQSFAQGANFPTEHPFFSHELIRAYFLFYFQAGNLEYLGLNPAWSNNILSILSTTALLALVMTLGRVLFNSRIAGRIGAALFFFQGSLSFVPFLRSQTSFSGLLQSLSTMTSFLNSGLGHRGEDWGIWSQNVYLTQRNFASSIGLLLIVLIFLLIRYRRAERSAEALPSTAEDRAVMEGDTDPRMGSWLSLANLRGPLSPFVFCGVLMGLMPMWNGAVLADGLIILGLMLAMFPLRREVLVLLAVTALLAVPQLIYLKTGARPGNFSFFHWGYLLDDPSLATVLYYLLFTFGFKWLLMGIGVAWSGNLERRFFAAASALLVFAFCTQFTEEILTNHKFFNIWLVIANVYVAYGLVRLWQLRVWSTSIPARAAAALLVITITIAGTIDLMPIHNSRFIEMGYGGDKLVEWVKTNTDPRAVFLSDRYMNHQILLAGRRLFYGQPYYAGEAGGDTARRDPVYKTLFESSDPAEVLRLLYQYNIKYVAIDDPIRNGRDLITHPNEPLYRDHFKLVFEDAESHYANIRIYEIP
uniref:Uncharacterized protein n=1 Tax=uncultured bacterium 164 TaxID=698382 RepID=E3T6Y3_9BACT|nr:hypothetical protein [uncultured bacterium 164]